MLMRMAKRFKFWLDFNPDIFPVVVVGTVIGAAVGGFVSFGGLIMTAVGILAGSVVGFFIGSLPFWLFQLREDLALEALLARETAQAGESCQVNRVKLPDVRTIPLAPDDLACRLVRSRIEAGEMDEAALAHQADCPFCRANPAYARA